MTWLKRDAAVCHWCREKFQPGQVRYVISDGIEAYPCWERVSICGPCWEDYGPQSAPSEPRKRIERACAGCGEPIMVTGGYHRSGWHDYVCSNRCHQRARRKIKQKDRFTFKPKSCVACQRKFKPTRADARCCSNACRQWLYRRRKEQKPGNGLSRPARHVTSRVLKNPVTIRYAIRASNP